MGRVPSARIGGGIGIRIGYRAPNRHDTRAGVSGGFGDSCWIESANR